MLSLLHEQPLPRRCPAKASKGASTLDWKSKEIMHDGEETEVKLISLF